MNLDNLINLKKERIQLQSDKKKEEDLLKIKYQKINLLDSEIEKINFALQKTLFNFFDKLANKNIKSIPNFESIDFEKEYRRFNEYTKYSIKNNKEYLGLYIKQTKQTDNAELSSCDINGISSNKSFFLNKTNYNKNKELLKYHLNENQRDAVKLYLKLKEKLLVPKTY